MKSTTDNILAKFLEGFKESYFVRVGTKDHNLFIGKDEKNRFCFEYRGSFIPVRLYCSSPLVISQYKGDNNIYILRFSLEQDDLISCFSAFCEDLIGSVANVSDENIVYKTLSARYQAWRKLFKPNGETLRETEIMGLIGELTFLRNYAIPHWGIDTALTSWTGPEKTHKDFSNNKAWFEIKTINVGKETVHISSIEQLDSDTDGILYVYFLERLSPTYNGITLNSIITELYSGFNLLQKDMLLNKLELFKYDFNQSYDSYVYAVRDECAYIVKNGFPRIIRENVPNPISKVQYDVIISEILTFKTLIQ